MKLVVFGLSRTWHARGRVDAFIDTLVKAWASLGGGAQGIQAGCAYVAVRTIDGCRATGNYVSRLHRAAKARPAWTRCS